MAELSDTESTVSDVFIESVYNYTRGEKVHVGERGRIYNIYDVMQSKEWKPEDAMIAYRSNQTCIGFTKSVRRLKKSRNLDYSYDVDDSFNPRHFFELPLMTAKFIDLGNLNTIRTKLVNDSSFWYVYNTKDKKYFFLGQLSDLKNSASELGWTDKEDLVFSDTRNIYCPYKAGEADTLCKQYCFKDIRGFTKVYLTKTKI